MLTTLPDPQGAILDTLREKLKDEPCVKESRGYRLSPERLIPKESPLQAGERQPHLVALLRRRQADWRQGREAGYF